jgi:hypothetical protein
MSRRHKRRQRKDNTPNRDALSRTAQPAPEQPENPAADGPNAVEVALIVKELREQRESIETLAAKNPKDVWDRLAVLATLFSSVVIATLGLIATQTFQRSETNIHQSERAQKVADDARQRQIDELELVAKLLPALTSSDQNVKKQAFLMVKALGNVELMTTLALDDAGVGAEAALASVATAHTTPVSPAKDFRA